MTSAPSSRRATSWRARSTMRSSATAWITSTSTSATASPTSCGTHFPNIHEKLLGLGIDITREPIPVVPAQHYTCGGVMVDLDGRTDAPGLYAAGEVTQSGLHGANRLASNSLLECVVFGEAAARHIAANWDDLPSRPLVRAWDESRVTDSDEEVVIQQCWGEIRRFMWNFVGIVRTTKRLERAKHRIDLLRQEVADYYKHFRVTPDLIELRNLVEVADLIVRSALSRHESRGLHYTLDYPEMAGRGGGHGACPIRSQVSHVANVTLFCHNSRLARLRHGRSIGSFLLPGGAPPFSPGVIMPATDLIISEYIEGSNNKKQLNSSTVRARRFNLTGYRVLVYFNGSLTPTFNVPLTGTIPAGGVFVLAQSTASAAILARANQTTTQSWFNGDDAIVLVKNPRSQSARRGGRFVRPDRF